MRYRTLQQAYEGMRHGLRFDVTWLQLSRLREIAQLSSY